jgi:hypothetical protein
MECWFYSRDKHSATQQNFTNYSTLLLYFMNFNNMSIHAFLTWLLRQKHILYSYLTRNKGTVVHTHKYLHNIYAFYFILSTRAWILLFMTLFYLGSIYTIYYKSLNIQNTVWKLDSYFNKLVTKSNNSIMTFLVSVPPDSLWGGFQ